MDEDRTKSLTEDGDEDAIKEDRDVVKPQVNVADDEDGKADNPQVEDSSTSTGQHSSQSHPTLSQFINQKKTWDHP